MYYLVIYYDEYQNKRRVLCLHDEFEYLDILEGIHPDRLIIPLDEAQYQTYINMPGNINF